MLWKLRRALQTVLQIGLIGSGAILPILRAAPCSDDFAFHLLRAAQLNLLWEQGVFYSRWAADMAQGYGYPLFNYYAPLSSYGVVFIHQLGPSLELAVRLLFAMAIWGGGCGLYLLARQQMRPMPALVAATVYLYAPYWGYDVYFRGNLAESVAWLFLPLALWGMNRWLISRNGRWLGVSAGIYAALLLTHNVFALIFTPLLFIYGLGQLGKAVKIGDLWRILLPMGLGLGMSAFFWMPALLERGFVHSDRLLVPPIFVYWNNFPSLAELFALPRLPQPFLLNPSPPRALGAIPFGILFLFAIPKRFSFRPPASYPFWLGLLLYLVLMLPLSAPVWEFVPLLEMVQFPWRLLGPAALCLAMLVGFALDSLPRWLATYQGWIGAVLILTFSLTHLFWFDPRPCPAVANPTQAEIWEFEQATATIGTTAKGEYLPQTVQEMPAMPATSAFALPDSATLLTQEIHPLSRQATLELAVPTVITVNLFAYPGWQAEIDNQPMPITPSVKQGLITVAIDAGTHQLHIFWRETPVRQSSWLITAVSWLLAIGCWFWTTLRQPPTPNKQPPITNYPLLIGLIILCLTQLVLPRWVSTSFTPNQLPASFISQPRTFQDGLSLLGYTIDPVSPPSPQLCASSGICGSFRWRIDLYWTVTAPPTHPYQSTLILSDAQGQNWSAKSSELPRDFRQPPDSRLWQAGQLVIDSHLVTADAGTPPATYRLQLHLFDKQTLTLLPLVGQPPQPSTLTHLTISRPAQPPPLAALPITHSAHVQWHDLALLGWNSDRTVARPGDPFALTLFWQANSSISQPYTLTLSLTPNRPLSETIFIPLTPAVPHSPNALPQSGDIWRTQHSFRLPAKLTTTDYTLQLHPCPSCAPIATLSPLAITAPNRLWQPPISEIPVDLQFGDWVRLVGATTHFSATEQKLSLTLVWQAKTETTTSYRFFVHLLDENNQILVQMDGEPVNWTRPTTGWIAGEFVVEAYQLNVPASSPPYTLSIGMYDPLTFNRLPLSTTPPSDSFRLSIDN